MPNDCDIGLIVENDKEWRKHILSEMQEMRKDIKEHRKETRKDIKALTIDTTTLKVKNGILITIVGTISGFIGSLIKFYTLRG